MIIAYRSKHEQYVHYHLQKGECVYNGNGINNPQWNKSVAVGGRLEFGSTKEGFRTSAKVYNLKNADGFTDTYWGADLRYAAKDFKIEAEYMTKEMNGKRTMS